MIIGIGTDIVQIPRIERLLDIYRDAFISRILSEHEQDTLANLEPSKQAHFFAKRFAAKEAISKALGTGIRQGLRFKDIVISNDKLGKPLAYIIGSCIFHTTCGFSLKQVQIHLSLADDYPAAIAFAIITQ